MVERQTGQGLLRLYQAALHILKHYSGELTLAQVREHLLRFKDGRTEVDSFLMIVSIRAFSMINDVAMIVMRS